MLESHIKRIHIVCFGVSSIIDKNNILIFFKMILQNIRFITTNNINFIDTRFMQVIYLLVDNTDTINRHHTFRNFICNGTKARTQTCC